MINELKEFWSKYTHYQLHPDDEKYLGQNKDKYCLEISIEEIRKKYGHDLKADQTREKFISDKNNKNKILTNLLVVPFFGDVENAKIYILMGNPGFHTGDYVDEIETVVKEITRVSQPGTTLVITAPKSPTIFQFLRVSSAFRKSVSGLPPIVNSLTRKEFENLLEHHDFKIMKMRALWDAMWIISAKKT